MKFTVAKNLVGPFLVHKLLGPRTPPPPSPRPPARPPPLRPKQVKKLLRPSLHESVYARRQPLTIREMQGLRAVVVVLEQIKMFPDSPSPGAAPATSPPAAAFAGSMREAADFLPGLVQSLSESVSSTPRKPQSPPKSGMLRDLTQGPQRGGSSESELADQAMRVMSHP